MKTMRTLFTLLLLALTVPVLAAPGDVTWTAKLAPVDARAGEGAQIVLTAQIEGDYHLYSLTKRDTGPTVTTLTLEAGAHAGSKRRGHPADAAHRTRSRLS